MLKVIAITKPPKYFYRIGEDFNHSVWYSFEKVKDVPVKSGDLVEIKYDQEGKDRILTEIKVTGKASSDTTQKPWRSKSPEESESIRKQAVGKMVAETVKAAANLSGKDLAPLVKELFPIYNELTK